ncbi:TVB1 protein, partial [Amia calva]|nr:TVB1 protein [Amia calva]
LTFFSLSNLYFSDFSHGLKVIQIPDKQLKNLKENTILHCEYDTSGSYYIYWYQKNKTGGLPLIGNSPGKDSAYLESDYEESEFTITRPESRKSTLEIKSLESGDTAVYFCAAGDAQ